MSNQRFPSATRTATFIGDDNPKVSGNHGCTVVLDITVAPGAETLTVFIEGKDATSGQYYTILSSSAKSAVSTTRLTVQPGGLNTNNVAVNDSLPDVYRVRVVHSASGSWTYSVNVVELL